MKFWQIAAAVLIFKLLDLCLVVGATVAPGDPPIVIYLIALIVWLLPRGSLGDAARARSRGGAAPAGLAMIDHVRQIGPTNVEATCFSRWKAEIPRTHIASWASCSRTPRR
jgi:hypothetical protein